MTTTASSPAIVVTNPATDSVVAHVPDTCAEDVSRIVAELRICQPAWEESGADARGVWLAKLRDWLLDHDAEIADILQSETGKARAEAGIEVPMICELINYYATHAAAFLADERQKSVSAVTAQKKLVKSFRPYPVVGIITPWNFPFAMPGMDAIPALAAGAAVLIKPSEVTPLGAQVLERGWTEIGAPPVLRVVTGLGATGAAVVEHADFVQFTGSTKTGRAIGAHAASLLKPYSLELGGKDPAIVLADADVDRAVNGIAWGALMNSGQVCVSIERVYVEEPVYEAFVTKLAAKVASLRQGHDDDGFRQDVGALATKAQQAIVAEHVQDAIASGARVLTGGKPGPKGTFFEPTVLVDVDHTMSCMREETFGPTIPVMKVTDAEEAIRLANDSPYGLSATVWTGNTRRGEAIARRLEAGAVNVNDVLINLFAFPLPHGGWKDSGVGARFGGPNGVRKYCRTQVVTVPRVRTMKNEMNWYPYKAGRAKFSARMVRLFVARDARRRFSTRAPKA